MVNGDHKYKNQELNSTQQNHEIMNKYLAASL